MYYKLVVYFNIGLSLWSTAHSLVVPTNGGVVPVPQGINYKTTTLSLDGSSFKFTPNIKNCDVIDNATERYVKIIFGGKTKLYGAPVVNPPQVMNVDVVITSKACEKLPSPSMNENYTLEVSENGSASLTATSVWGALRGLETFSQLVYKTSGGHLTMNATMVIDFPRFQHRGLMIDTARHYLPLDIIYQNIDLMAQNKLNVLHWHIVDDQSFPFQSTRFPNLNLKGAYTPTHFYSPADVSSVIEYARLRGIRVIPEFDTPGHTQSWGAGQPNLLTKCYTKGAPDGTYGPIDPSNFENYDFLLALLQEVTAAFPDQYIHLGGDEVPFGCWLGNPDIVKFMQIYNISVGANLEQYYIQHLLQLVEQARENISYVVWQEVFDNKVKVNPSTIIHEWKSGSDTTRGYELGNITHSGLRALTSSCWYLNDIAYGIDWHKYYECDPQNFKGTKEQKDLVLGGEACMWGEYVDATNSVARTWPRASVVAERLWSAGSNRDPNKLAPRLEEHRCRLLNRGYQVEPINGPGFCPQEWS